MIWCWRHEYHHSYSEYYSNLDECIKNHGTTNGELNKLGKMIADYKAHVQKINIKENWSVLRYIGESTDSILLTGFTHGRYYYMAIDEFKKTYGIFDNEEYYAVGCLLNSDNWEIVEDPTGKARKMLNATKTS